LYGTGSLRQWARGRLRVFSPFFFLFLPFFSGRRRRPATAMGKFSRRHWRVPFSPFPLPFFFLGRGQPPLRSDGALFVSLFSFFFSPLYSSPAKIRGSFQSDPGPGPLPPIYFFSFFFPSAPEPPRRRVDMRFDVGGLFLTLWCALFFFFFPFFLFHLGPRQTKRVQSEVVEIGNRFFVLFSLRSHLFSFSPFFLFSHWEGGEGAAGGLDISNKFPFSLFSLFLFFFFSAALTRCQECFDGK